MKFRIIFPLIALSSLAFAQGQDAKEEKPVPPAQVSILAVGGVSDNVANWKDGATFTFEATDADATPPMDLYVEQMIDKKKIYKPLPLSLNMATPMTLTPPGQPMLLFRQKIEAAATGAAGSAPKETVSYQQAMSIPVSAIPVSLVVMWRDKANPKWAKPNVTALDVAETTFPMDQVCFLNLTGAPVKITLMKENKTLEARGKWITLPSAAANGLVPYKIEVALKDKMLPVTMTSLSKRPNTRSMIAVYALPNGVVQSSEIPIPKPTVPKPVAPQGGVPGAEGSAGAVPQTTMNR